MNFGMYFSIALDSLQANKLRSVLTMLGIVIGVAAVIVLMSIGTGTQAMVTSRITSLGSNLIFARAGAPPSAQTGGVRQAQGSAVTLTLEDAKALEDQERAPSVLAVAPEFQNRSQVVAGGRNTNTNIVGVTESYLEVRSYEMADGEFITQTNLDSRALIAILGSQTATDLFPDQDPLGQQIRIGRQQFRVAGILASKGGTGFGSADDIILVPITTALTRLSNQRTTSAGQRVSSINIKVVNEKEIDNAKIQIAAILRERHKLSPEGEEDDFTLTSQEDTIATLNQITGVFTAFLGSIAGISLLVGGIGIMNIMLVSVTERTREIGIRKAVGAKKVDLLAQFLVEATALSLTGGAIGLGMGYGISRLVSGMNLNGQTINTVVSPEVAMLAVTVSAAVGLFFGIYPATRAASLHPIQALRYE